MIQLYVMWHDECFVFFNYIFTNFFIWSMIKFSKSSPIHHKKLVQLNILNLQIFILVYNKTTQIDYSTKYNLKYQSTHTSSIHTLLGYIWIRAQIYCNEPNTKKVKSQKNIILLKYKKWDKMFFENFIRQL